MVQKIVYTISVNKKELWLKGVLFLSANKGYDSKKVLFLSTKRGYSSKVSSRQVIFLCLTCPVAIKSRTISRCQGLRFVFLSFKRVWQARSCSESWRISNYQISDPTKTHFFCCLIFEEFEKRFMDQKFYCLFPRQAWSMSLFDFQNRAPRGTKVFIQMVSKWNGVFF